MTILYHEKQESALCGQHCLNNLLQGPYFNAGALADIAHELDRKEQALMMSEGMTADAIAFMREASGNVDAQGNFSIQVLSEALKRSFGLELSDVRHEEVLLRLLLRLHRARPQQSQPARIRRGTPRVAGTSPSPSPWPSPRCARSCASPRRRRASSSTGTRTG